MVVSLLFSLHDFLRDYLIEKFPICQLPRLALYEVLRSMSEIELIRLTLTSSKMESIVKTARIELPLYNIQVRGRFSNFDFGKEVSILFCGDKEFPRKEKVSKHQMKKWSDKESGVDNLGEIRARLKNIFKCNEEILVIKLSQAGNLDIENNSFLLDAMQNSIELFIQDGEISSKNLSFIMENANPKQIFELAAEVVVPEGFESPHAFKFQNIIYMDAHWVKLKDLFTIRNVNYVKLGKNKLRSVQFNLLIKYWSKCDHEMWLVMDIHLTVLPNMNILFKGLLVLATHYAAGMLYFVLSKSTKKRRTILSISWTPEGLWLYSYSYDEKVTVLTNGPKRTFRREYEVLKALTRKKVLESKRKLLKKEKKELEKLKNKLEKYQVRFVDGMPTIDR